jgi:predicted Zn-dependent peptidase
MDYEEKIRTAQQQIIRLEKEIDGLTGIALQITEVENNREIAKINEQIAKWQSRLDETPDRKEERKRIEKEESSRLEWLNNNLARLEQNDWDY